MSTTTPTPGPLLHIWDIVQTKTVDETTSEERDGQTIQVTRKVEKPVVTRMALKKPSKRELKEAELFYGRQYSSFVSMGFIPRSIMINKHLDLSGGILSEKERKEADVLNKRQIEIENQLAKLATVPDQEGEKVKLQAELVTIRNEAHRMLAANEAAFSQTAEAKAQNQLSTWFALYMILVDRGTIDSPKWVQYFEGKTFDEKEEAMWKLDEAADGFYLAATEKIATYVYWLSKGADKPEMFAAMDAEMKRQNDARKTEEAKEQAKLDVAT